MAVLTAMMLVSCSKPAPAAKPAESPAAVPAESPEIPETAAAEKTPEPVKTPAPAPTPDQGPFSDPDAFAGFDAYREWNAAAEIRLGETLFSEEDYGIQRVRQLNYGGHEMIKDAETLEPGAVGLVITDYSTKLGGQVSYYVKNASDAPASVTDCVIIGLSSPESVTFSNGIGITEGTQDSAVLEELKAVLGEPYQGSLNSYSGSDFVWRDEKEKHILRLHIYGEGDSLELSGLTYINYALAD